MWCSARHISPKEKAPVKVLLAEAVGFEPTCDCSQTDFEQKAVSTAPPLSVPEIFNISICSARI